MRMLVFLLGCCITGCGPSSVSVSGTVTFEGKKVVYGTVALTGSDGITKYGTIQPDGSFTIADVRTGSNKVFVSSPAPPGVNKPVATPIGGRDDEFERRGSAKVAPASDEILKAWFPLPDKFGDPNQATLTVEIERDRPLIIELK